MIVREFAIYPEMSFDFFNDYKDTHAWLLSTGHVAKANRLTERRDAHEDSKAKGFYRVKIAIQGKAWIARQVTDGVWRTRGDVLPEHANGFEGQQLAEYLFHKEEILSVEVIDGVTFANIRIY